MDQFVIFTTDMFHGWMSLDYGKIIKKTPMGYNIEASYSRRVDDRHVVCVVKDEKLAKAAVSAAEKEYKKHRDRVHVLKGQLQKAIEGIVERVKVE